MLMMTNVILHKGVSSFVSVYFSDITSHLFSWLVKNLFTFVCCFINVPNGLCKYQNRDVHKYFNVVNLELEALRLSCFFEISELDEKLGT